MIEKLEYVESVSSKSRVGKLLHHPLRYSFAMLFKELVYPVTKRMLVVQTKLFFGDKMKVALPASTDIFLTGGKSHSSEIRLAKFLILNLKEDDVFFDVGAHYGYFSLLASALTGTGGMVFAFEPSPESYKILEENSKKYKQLQTYNYAVSDTAGTLVFYQFPNLYSEYNSFDISQFIDQPWFDVNRPENIHVQTVSMDSMVTRLNKIPHIIKIDVEGAENKVIQGAYQLLTKHAPVIIMEYLTTDRGNLSHIEAKHTLSQLGYVSYLIDNKGKLFEIENIDNYLEEHKLESDNIVFIKKQSS